MAAPKCMSSGSQLEAWDFKGKMLPAQWPKKTMSLRVRGFEACVSNGQEMFRRHSDLCGRKQHAGKQLTGTDVQLILNQKLRKSPFQ
jgi:hypothetical protein